MEQGFLIVSVFDENISQPINNAVVKVSGENYEQSFSTNESGKTQSIELQAPLKIYSLTPQSQVRPYSVYDIEVSSPGFTTTIINGVKVFPEETSLQNVFLTANRNRQSDNENKVINLPPHTLWETTVEALDEQDDNKKTDVENRVHHEVFIPEYVIVHDGVPSNSNARQYYVNFIDYIKNVASNEVYSTWPRESLKANIYAMISFTLNRIYTEWYKSRGYNFTVTSSPSYDQTYVNNGTIFKSIADIVDEIFNYYIKNPNQNFPFLAQYNDGIKVNNPGWLSQWGSKSLADQGYTSLEILRYYYDNQLKLVAADEIIGLPTSFPGYNLVQGSCGEPVQKIQIMLNTISGNYPAIPKIIPTDGRFLENTTKSVKTFQQVFNLPVTGIVDFATWYQISYIFIAVNKMLRNN